MDNEVKFKVKVGDGVIHPHSGLRVRKKLEGFLKFAIEIIQNWRPSDNPKLKDGVDYERTIDKEKREYHHITKDALTGEITHEEHEPLEQHKQQKKQTPKNVKKPKPQKGENKS